MQKLTRRGLIMGGSALLAGCATASQPTVQAAATFQPVLHEPLVSTTPQTMTAELNTTRPLDPRGYIRRELMERAQAALDIHQWAIPNRDRMYLVDFQKFSGEERLYEVDLEGGDITLMRTAHGKGSDPSHSGWATRFGNTPDSLMSSVGAYRTGGPGWGPEHGPNVLLDGLEYSNDKARERAIIVHGADYADPDFLAREGKLGRSYGCFSVARADLPRLRDRMGEGRLLFAWA